LARRTRNSFLGEAKCLKEGETRCEDEEVGGKTKREGGVLQKVITRNAKGLLECGKNHVTEKACQQQRT